MPAVAELPAVLVDTSVAVALLVADHEHHVATRSALGTRAAGLAGHAAFETFSVLTRPPAPAAAYASGGDEAPGGQFPFPLLVERRRRRGPVEEPAQAGGSPGGAV